jgi:DNA helicase-2/ATP-dependent DNA helicase PcrA
MPKNTELFRASNRAPAHHEAGQQIVTTSEPYVEVLASPGSGKTHTLIARLSHLLASGVPAAQILVLSFSNEAVRELRRRLDLFALEPNSPRTQYPYSDIRIQTAHAFARSLLRKPLTLLSESQQRKLLKSALKGMRQSMRNQELWADLSLLQKRKRRECLEELQQPHRLRWLLALFDRARASGAKLKTALQQATIDTDVAGQQSHPAPALVAAVFRHYQRAKDRQAGMDYGDMLNKGIQRLQQATGSKKFKTNFQHILVDEYQDCGAAQSLLIGALARHCNANVMVFGDPLQAIYGFAGSHYQQLALVLPTTQTLQLPVSHRLTAETAALACAVARQPLQAIQTLRSGRKPVLICSDDENAQARTVAHDIQKLIAGGVPVNQIAVLSRVKALLNPVEAELAALSINTARIGQRRELQHVLNVLRLIRLHRRYHRKQLPIAPEVICQFKIEGRVIDLADAEKTAKQLMGIPLPPSLAGQYKACCTAYLRLLGGVRATINKDIAHEINRWAAHSSQYATLAAFRQGIKAIATNQKQCVTTGTIHAAKGREWSHVLIVGVADGILPHRAACDADMLMQEQNLMYVAVTRAKDRVHLYHSPIVNARSRQRFSALSRHLNTRARSLMLIQKSAAKKADAESVTAH